MRLTRGSLIFFFLWQLLQVNVAYPCLTGEKSEAGIFGCRSW